MTQHISVTVNGTAREADVEPRLLLVHLLVLLEDDRGLQPRENVVPLVRTAVLTAYDGRIEEAIEPVTAALTTAELIELNRTVEIESTTHASAAKEWLDRLPLTS